MEVSGHLHAPAALFPGNNPGARRGIEKSLGPIEI